MVIPFRQVALSTALILFVSSTSCGATAEEIAEEAMPSVVQIVTYNAAGDKIGNGSGFFVSSSEIVTNHHVIDGACSAEVFSDLSYYNRVVILNTDTEKDLALLGVVGQGEPSLLVDPYQKPKPGQRIFVIGYPLGYGKTFSDGLVSATPKQGEIQEVQITAPMSPGSSGSPVLDEESRVIGVACSSVSEGQNLNFAISAEALTEFLAQPKNHRPLPAAGYYIPLRFIMRWAIDIVLTSLLVALIGCVVVRAILDLVKLCRGLPWFCRSVWRVVKPPFPRNLELPGLNMSRLCRHIFPRFARGKRGSGHRLHCPHGGQVPPRRLPIVQ